MDAPILVKNIMTKEVISIRPEMPLLDGAKLLIQHDFHGIPVVDNENKLIGLLTEYDLISKNSFIHLPTLQIVLQKLAVNSQDRSGFEEELKELRMLTVKDFMNTEPITLTENDSYEDAVRIFREHHRVNPIPVMDENRRVIGVLSRFDVLRPLGLI